MRNIHKSESLFELRHSLEAVVAYVHLTQRGKLIQNRQLPNLVMADVQLHQLRHAVEEPRRELAQRVVREIHVREPRAVRERRRRDRHDAVCVEIEVREVREEGDLRGEDV
jgi:hypothetical protein